MKVGNLRTVALSAKPELRETQLTEHLVELSMGPDGEPPVEFRLLKAGANRTSKGTFLYTDRSQTSVMEAWATVGNECLIDYNHAANAPAWAVANPSEAGKAAGWHKLETRSGELWAVGVSWTPAAAEKLRAREFRYISPTLRHTEDGEVMEYVNCALTNTPATYGAPPLMASQHTNQQPPQTENTHMDKKLIIAALGLNANATDAEIEAAVNAAATAQKATAELLQLSGSNNVSDALGRARAWQQGAASAAELAKQVEAQKQTQLAAQVKEALDAAERDRKVVPAQREMLTKLGMGDLAQLNAFLAAMPAVVPAPAAAPTSSSANTAGTSLSAEETAVATMLSISPTDLEAHKKVWGGSIRTAPARDPEDRK